MRRFFLLVLLLAWPALASASGLNVGADAYESGDYVRALAEWQPLAEAGDPLAQYNVGLLYRYGLGLDSDMDKAVDLFESAARQGQPDAQVAIGDLFLEGVWGEPDKEEAAAWYGLAAKQGHVEAQQKLDSVRAN